MLNQFAGCLIVLSFAVFTLAEPKIETPADGISAMIALLEKDDLKGLFLQRYGELERFAKTDEEKQKIVGEMVAKFASKKDMLLEQFRKAKGIVPELSERNGQKVATFKIDKGQITLYQKNGIWTFHL